MKKSEYDIQAEAFMAAHSVTMTAQYLGRFPRLGEWSTSQWQVTFTRQGRKPFTLTFSQSLQNSWRYFEDGKVAPNQGLPPRLRQEHWPKTSEPYRVGPYTLTPVKAPPSAYNVLACLTKYDPGTFKDFCGDYGYNDDSIKAFDIYRAVQEEWEGVRRVFGDCLEKLQEIN